jgi:hypothetical protein
MIRLGFNDIGRSDHWGNGELIRFLVEDAGGKEFVRVDMRDKNSDVALLHQLPHRVVPGQMQARAMGLTEELRQLG